MTNLLMISGDRSLAAGKQGAFYNTLSELHTHFDRIDIICPSVQVSRYDMSVFGNVFVYPSPWPILFQPLWILRKGRQLLTTHHYALATVHEYAPFYNGLGARLLARSTSLPYLLEIMHVPGVPRASGIRERLYRWLTHMFIAWDARPARAVRVINEYQTPDFLVAAGVPREKLIYIPASYIDLETFKPAEVESRQKQYDIAFVGRMVGNKGLDIFLDVMERTGLVGIAIGDGPLLAWARNESKRRGLKIHFPGFASDAHEVARYLNESRLLVMPSLNEGGPRIVLEAMACGLPVVATPVGIVPDILPPECIEEWNTDDIADKVRNILQDESLYLRLSQQGLITARRFERVAAIKAYAEGIKRLIDLNGSTVSRLHNRDATEGSAARSSGSRLLVICQKVDETDDLLGFFVSWLRQFARHFDRVDVIALGVGTYELPANVYVHSLGKESGASKLLRAFRFARLLWRYTRKSTAVFAHMSPIFAIAASPFTKIWHTKLVLWYLHRSRTLKLRLALSLVDTLVTADAQSLTIRSPKIVAVGHGIDVQRFAVSGRTPSDGRAVRILSVGRLSPIKGFETLIRAASLLRESEYPCEIRIVGKAIMSGDHRYEEQLHALVARLGVGDSVHFFGFVPYRDMPAHYRWADIVVGCTPPGGVDKAILEGMAASCTVVTSNTVMRKYFVQKYADECIFRHGDSANLAEKLGQLFSADMQSMGIDMQKAVMRDHNLPATIEKIVTFL